MPAAPCFFLIQLIPKTNSGGSQRTHRSRVMARWIAAGFSRGRSAPDHRYDVIGLNPQNMQMGRQGCLRTGWYRGKDGRQIGAYRLNAERLFNPSANAPKRSGPWRSAIK